jgi:hypothetical protein
VRGAWFGGLEVLRPMASRTPRGGRRRRPTESSFPVIPIAIGVVILGFAIGAGIPALRRQQAAVVAVATATPTQSPEPFPTASDLPTESPSPRATATPSPRVAQAASSTPTPRATPTPKATKTPASAPEPTRSPSPEALATTIPSASLKPPKPSPLATLRTVQVAPSTIHLVATPVPPPAPTSAPDAPLLRDAQQTVRTYIEALIAGDDTTAQSQLLANSGTPNAALSEKSFLDRDARIIDISASATSPTTAAVNVDVRSAKGLYYAHYEVRRLDTGVTLIREHNYIKP